MSLPNIVTWVIREMRLHGFVSSEVVFNLKRDGHPFFGKWPIKRFHSNSGYILHVVVKVDQAKILVRL